MIDTIHLIYGFRSHKEIEECIDSLKERYILDFHYRETSDNSKYPLSQYRCCDNNFRIWLISDQLHIEGSICKFYFGNNIQQFDRTSLVQAYEMFLNKYDFVDWRLAKHKRIDISANFELSTSPSFVMNKLLGSKRMKKSIVRSHSESVTIGNNSQSIIFYNKSLEAVDKPQNNIELKDIPNNLLRVEYRVTGVYPMKKYFKSDKITIPYIVDNLHLLPKIWHEMYLNIDKDYSTTIDLVCSRKELEMKAIINLGLEQAKLAINESYKAGLITQAIRVNLNKFLKEVVEYKKSNSSQVDIIKELDEKVEIFIANNTFS